MILNDELKRKSDLLYLVLAGIFIALLVTCNLIFQKFISINFLGIYTFHISAGLIAYPVTFLVTDLISEIFGEKKANHVVIAGLIASLVILVIVILADMAPSISNSPVDDRTFSKVFGLTLPAVLSSLGAYLIAQLIDIRLFHFWKKLTNGKHLWLRNNMSTIFSQLFDTAIVLVMLCSFGSLPWDIFWQLFVSSFLFKLIFAIFDTPFFYLFVFIIKKRFGMNDNDELI